MPGGRMLALLMLLAALLLAAGGVSLPADGAWGAWTQLQLSSLLRWWQPTGQGQERAGRQAPPLPPSQQRGL